MKLKVFTLLLLVAFAPAGVHAICARGPNAPEMVYGSIVSCRSALPQIEAVLERRRDAYEERAQPMRERIPNADQMWGLRPYDEVKAHHLSRVEGVIVTFALEGQIDLPDGAGPEDKEAKATWHALPEKKQHEIFLRIGGSSCDLLPRPAPTVLVSDFVCCDVVGSSEDSCILDLPTASLPPESLLESLHGDA